MNLLFLISGILILVIALVDALWTTFWTEGVAGPVSSRVSKVLWRTWRWMVPASAHRALSLAGPSIMFSIVVLWVLLLWTGWTLIFCTQASNLAYTSDHTYPGFWGRLYFTAMALFTMGIGDITPRGSAWQVTTALANANGFLILTLIISYVLSVLGAEVNKRAFARQVTALGKSGPDFLIAGWNGKNLRDLELPLSTITSRLGLLTEHHLAYPVLHYFQPIDKGASAIPAIAILEDALAILLFAIPEENNTSIAARRSLQGAIDDYYNTAKDLPVVVHSELPPPPELNRVRQESIPVTCDDSAFAVQVTTERGSIRKMLNGEAKNTGWDWPTTDA